MRSISEKTKIHIFEILQSLPEKKNITFSTLRNSIHGAQLYKLFIKVTIESDRQMDDRQMDRWIDR